MAKPPPQQFRIRPQMANEQLPSFHLTKKNDNWSLEKAGSNRAVRTFRTKAEALKGGVLRDAVGRLGGSVKIHNENGRIQQERTYPRVRDPQQRKG